MKQLSAVSATLQRLKKYSKNNNNLIPKACQIKLKTPSGWKELRNSE